MATVHQLRPAQKASYQARRNRRVMRALRRQSGTAIGVGLVAATLTALSLSHLAHGIAIVTSADVWEAWAMSIAPFRP